MGVFSLSGVSKSMLSVSSIADSHEGVGKTSKAYSKLLPVRAVVYCKVLETASKCFLMESLRLACRDREAELHRSMQKVHA